MPIRRHYNNPAIGAAFSNLAQAFGPPDPGEALGWQKYGRNNALFAAEDEAYSTLAQTYGPAAAAAMRTGGGSGFAAFPKVDLYRQSLGASDPRSLDSSAYAVFGNAGNTFAGMDDQQAADAALHQNELEAQLEREMALQAAKPLSQDQVLAGQLQAGIAADPSFAGNYTTSQLTGMGVEEVVGPDGGVVIQPRAASVGMTPAPDSQSAPKLQLINYRLPDGGVGHGTFNPVTGALLDAYGSPLDPGAVTSVLQDTSASFAPSTTTDNQLRKARVSFETVDNEIKFARELLAKNPNLGGLSGRILGGVQDAMQTAKDLVGTFGSEDGMIRPSDLQRLQQETDARLRGSGAYDPTFAQFTQWQIRYAYARAQQSNPTGEVGQKALERELQALGGGMFANRESLMAALDQDERSNRARREDFEREYTRTDRGGPAPASPAQDTPATPPPGAKVIKFIRGENGLTLQGQ